MKRFEISRIYELAEQLKVALNKLDTPRSSGIEIWFAIFGAREGLYNFSIEQQGLPTSRRLASDAIGVIENWANQYVRGSDGNFDESKLKTEYDAWQYGSMKQSISEFRTVFLAEVRDLDVYLVDQVTIFRVGELVNNGSAIVPEPYYSNLAARVKIELDNAAKALAFELHTACGFHALRALEIILVDYLVQFGAPRHKLKNWGLCLKEAKALMDAGKDKKVPSARVVAMIERMKDLDRNPLMHPEDTLDEASAVNVLMNTATTIVELLRDTQCDPQEAEAVLAMATLLAPVGPSSDVCETGGQTAKTEGRK